MSKIKAKGIMFGDFLTITGGDGHKTYSIVTTSITHNNKVKLSCTSEMLAYYGFKYERVLSYESDELVEILDDLDKKNKIICGIKRHNIEAKKDSPPTAAFIVPKNPLLDVFA